MFIIDMYCDMICIWSYDSFTNSLPLQKNFIVRHIYAWIDELVKLPCCLVLQSQQKFLR